ncbi:MAG: ABC transporter substrate-binding protein [Alphaproteobacteria bacterium]|nr:MAG: ABC transporter substrate-binding protein [Alphaproteobacteria bacterium]
MRVLVRLLALAAIMLTAGMASAQTTLRVVMLSDLKILDPIWTTAYIVRDHGYMVYDTLLAMDAELKVKPQMVDSWTVSDDKLTYKFVLRDGLKFHDGQPVTAEDCVASIKRWGARDAMGQKLMQFTRELAVVDAKTFTLSLKEPFGMVLEALGKPSSSVPFIMPKRIAETPPDKQVSEFIGSGPFVFKKDQWRPGEKVVYEKFADYKPRPEPPSGLAGGKQVFVDRVEWVVLPDAQTSVNALIAGEIDMMQQPPFDMHPLLESTKGIKLVDLNTLGTHFAFRFNTLHKPFDDPRIRVAALYALSQKDSLAAGVGNPKYEKVCKDLFGCGTPLSTSKGWEDKLNGDTAKSKELLKAAGYDGTPVLLMHASDTAAGVTAPVAKQLLERGGFKVDMVSTDWQTVLARRSRKEPPASGGWSAFTTTLATTDILDPVVSFFTGAACEKASIGWPCDAQIEKLRDDFARTTDLARRKELAEALQVRLSEFPTYAPLGQFNMPVALRSNVSGNMEAPATVFWNVKKVP